MIRSLAFTIVLLIASTFTYAAPPNIVVILADDLGYGDVQCFNPDGKIKTPHIDALAASGMKFTDAHTPSAVCTPTRYGLMTGRYSWRSKLQNGVLGGLSPRLIEPNRETIASLLKANGYTTAAIGKWHLGMDWQLKPDTKVNELNIETRAQVTNVEYTKPIKNGPNSVGFDYYFGISASLDMVPYTFIENDHVTVNPTEDRDFLMSIGKAGKTRKGPTALGFEVEDVLPKLTQTAVQYIEKQAKGNKPFFLYLPLTTPHTPIAPSKDWAGKSGLGAYGDFVMETDRTVGDVMAALAKHKLTENTIVIFTSDNGCSPQADFPNLAKQGHNPSYKFRGHKADIFEGGHRVPFVVSGPGVTKGATSDQLVCLTDILRTCTDLAGVKVPETAGEDSISFLPTLSGKKAEGLRGDIVHHSINGTFAIREGSWKLCLCSGSGGWSNPKPASAEAKNLPATQLYNLKDDIGETKNVAKENEAIATKLRKLLEKQVADGRSTPGATQKNAVDVKIVK